MLTSIEVTHLCLATSLEACLLELRTIQSLSSPNLTIAIPEGANFMYVHI